MATQRFYPRQKDYLEQLNALDADMDVATEAAEASASAAEASRDAIDNRIYPGTYEDDPTTRPDESAIQNGDVFSLATGALRVRIAGAWQDWATASSLTGLSTASTADVTPADTPVTAIGKLQAKHTQLATSDGSALVGSDDGASGSLWTTVAGFIAKIISSAGSSVIGFIDASVGGVLRTVEDWMKDRTSVFNFMTSAQRADVRAGTALLDVTAAIQAAIDAVSAAGGGELFFPAGTYLVGPAGSSQAVVLASSVTLKGVGRVASTIKLADGADSHVIAATDVSNIAILSLTIDGSRATQTAQVHGIRLAGVDGATIDDLEIKECAHYGIGGQDGTLARIKLGRLDIHDTGGDGIDFKNRNDDNEDIQLSNISVRSWGLNPAQTIQAAIDIRGPARLANIVASEPGADDCYGVRFRQGELLDSNGFGGHRSSLTGFDIRMGSATDSVGLSVVARDVAASNGYISGGQRGVVVQDSGFRGSQVTVEGVADEGFLLDALGGGLDADRAVLTACKAYDCGDRGFSIEGANNQLIGCYSFDNDEGIVIDAAATGTKIIGGYVSGNATAQIGDLGTGTKIRDVDGYVTENRGSATIPNGSTSVTVTHGLSATPTASDIVITQQTSDGGASQFWIGNIGATTFDILTDANPGKDVPMTWWARVK